MVWNLILLQQANSDLPDIEAAGTQGTTCTALCLALAAPSAFLTLQAMQYQVFLEAHQKA